MPQYSGVSPLTLQEQTGERSAWSTGKIKGNGRKRTRKSEEAGRKKKRSRKEEVKEERESGRKHRITTTSLAPNFLSF